MFKRTTAINKLLSLKKRIKVIPGGTSAGKTYGILPILIDKASREPLEISVVSESIPHLRKGALKDFLKILYDTERFGYIDYNKTLLTAYFTNGSYIEFFSADQEGKVRGPRRHILYINECNNISFETYHQLAIRTSKEIWLDFNPSHEFWVHEELTNDPDAEWLTLTYKDNEALPESIVKEIEKGRDKGFIDPHGSYTDKSNIKNSYWANWWRVYGLGMLGSLEGVVFSNWSIIDNLPSEARITGFGLDFGYTNDPTAAVARYEYNGQRIYDEIIYQRGLKNNDIAGLLAQYKNVKGAADSAEPKSIDEINEHGFIIKPVEKGADSINYGIQLMQEGKFLVTSRSVNMIKELRNYTWDSDRNGNKINKPIDAFNHTIDAGRYIEMNINRMPNIPTTAKRGKTPRHHINRH